MVADEAVYELAYRVDEQHGRTDQSELAGGKHASVNEGLLDHAEAEAADIVRLYAAVALQKVLRRYVIYRS